MKYFKSIDYVFITGVTGVGKSTLLTKLMERDRNFGRLQILKKYTTRPKRKTDDNTIEEYIHIDQEQAKVLRENMKIGLETIYHTEHGILQYIFPVFEPSPDTTYVQVLGAGDLKAILEKGILPKNSIVINIRTDQKSILDRTKGRGEKEETKRRLKSDSDNIFGHSGKFLVSKNDPFWKFFGYMFNDRNNRYCISIRNPKYRLHSGTLANEIYTFMTRIEMHTTTKFLRLIGYIPRHITISPDKKSALIVSEDRSSFSYPRDIQN